MCDDTKPYCVEVHSPRDNVKLRLIRHSSPEGMHAELRGRYGDDKYYKALFDEAGALEAVHGLTVGEMDEAEGIPVINVYIPFGYSSEKYEEIIPHESLHVAMAILRYRISGDMFHDVPITVSEDACLQNNIDEETLAHLVGEVSFLIKQMVLKLDSSIASDNLK